MGKGVIELTCVGMVNILKYIPGVQGVDVKVHIRPYSFLLIPDELRMQKMCNKTMREKPTALFLYPTVLKHKRCVKKL